MEPFLLALGLFVVALAMVYIFAILGRLAALLPEQSGNSEARHDRLALAPASTHTPLPEGLRAWSDRLGILLTLSTTCAACRDIVADSAGLEDALEGSETGVVVVADSVDEAEAFLAETALNGDLTFPVAFDIGGTWSAAVGVSMTPALLRVQEGVLAEAFAVSSIEAIRQAIGEEV